ncbi:uncharacterized protein C7orf31 isoform X2 [Betta splendens]|uniref:Uncharacterized protein C7orf31 isoform X2 n=1 Tax=Betta splendens TaxID=158456 RepID=A0A6P7KTK2_BETSP|nr:uncharacterized protein C7orf31 isoform X2 [Betta splendens]
MESLSGMNVDTPSESSSRYGRGFAGSIPPVQTTSQLRCNTTCRKNSKVRLNDQLVPKPTDINIGEKLLIPPPKQHPYLSHMSRFAVFPSFCSPDDPRTGVRAASGPFLQPGIPSSAPHVTVLSKTIGAPHRHEILESPMKARKSVRWPEEHVFLDPTERRQVFYPTPPKAVLPNAALRDWELSLPERTGNMLKNLERALWLTSYQTHYTGSGPANPLQIDDFKEKMSGPAGMNPHSAPLARLNYCGAAVCSLSTFAALCTKPSQS